MISIVFKIVIVSLWDGQNVELDYALYDTFYVNKLVPGFISVVFWESFCVWLSSMENTSNSY